MSALAFVCKPHSVDVLTDSLSTDVDSGRVSDLSSKQVFIGSTGVLAMNGWALPCDWFAALVTANCRDFDNLVSRADELWGMVTSAVLTEFPDEKFRSDPFVYVVAIAGWSRARGRAEAYMLDSLTGEGGQFTGAIGRRPMKAFAMGGDGCDETALFIRKFWHAPEEFDAQRDGVPLFESMRAAGSTVGGFIQHSIVDEAGIHDAIIHTWSNDRVGKLVEVA